MLGFLLSTQPTAIGDRTVGWVTLSLTHRLSEIDGALHFINAPYESGDRTTKRAIALRAYPKTCIALTTIQAQDKCSIAK
jgi:hypothetical protein